MTILEFERSRLYDKGFDEHLDYLSLYSSNQVHYPPVVRSPIHASQVVFLVNGHSGVVNEAS